MGWRYPWGSRSTRLDGLASTDSGARECSATPSDGMGRGILARAGSPEGVNEATCWSGDAEAPI